MNIQLSQPGLDGAERPSSVRRHPQVAELLADGQPAPAAIDDFLASHEFPLVEPGRLTFAWRGAADHVASRALDPRRRRPAPVRAAAGTDLWLLRLPVRTAGGSSTSWRSGGTAARNGSWIRSTRRGPAIRSVRIRSAGPTATSAPSGASRAARPPGASKTWRSRARRSASAARSGSTCRPAIRPERAYPLVIIHDGEDFVTYADLPVVARQPDRRGRDPAGDRGAGADPRPDGRIFRRAAGMRASSSGSSCRRSRAR